ncbi:MAG: PBP1A family penicillin-binding protein [Bdellovibrionales bacterium]|nr:PBP1A family penicillin-binding protein [Bdellovibrionales bacterium]
MTLQKLKRILAVFALLLLLLCITIAIGMYRLSSQIDERTKNGWFLPPLEIYSMADPYIEGQLLDTKDFLSYLEHHQYRSRPSHLRLLEGDFSLWPHELCQDHIDEDLPTEQTFRCIALKTFRRKFGPQRESQLHLFVIDQDNLLYGLFTGEPLKRVKAIRLAPHLFAQFYDNKPMLRKVLPLSEFPLACLQGITAIEDNRFLDHQGISFVGMFRALIRNIFRGGIAQGGSTITQQLVKNYFLTPERTLKRKVTEILMAILLEYKLSKDEILEHYLNVIYMGQNGPFQVRGYGAAADHYFAKPISQLNVSECALLAAIVNSPGRYNPFAHPERALARRNRVLNKMQEYQMMDELLIGQATKDPLPQRPPKVLTEPAPYFVQAVLTKLTALNIDQEKGLRVFTTLREEAQETAKNAIRDNLKLLEKNSPLIQKRKLAGHPLEALIISINVESGEVIALVGGRKYSQTQYNRAMNSHRQVGSLMKPFVYMAALETSDEDGRRYTPLSAISDSPFTYKYEGQSWTPQNYDKKFQGLVPLFYALKNSLNVPTARLGTSIGLTSIIDVARRMGIESPISPLPSLTLGAFELFPWELTRAYSTLARMGVMQDNRFINQVEDLNGQVIFEPDLKREQVVAPTTAAVLIGMMKQTVLTGTARSLTSWRGFHHPTAGKTGTTSDMKDAWFVGFTPDVLTLVWVGYDQNLSHGLTGSSGAVPIWSQFMKGYAAKYPMRDFTWPEGVANYTLKKEQIMDMITDAGEHELVDTNLIIRSENMPTFE